MPDGNGHGVQLACSNCHEQWWEIKKDASSSADYKESSPERPFRNLTDISLLYQRQSGNYAYQTPAQDVEPTMVLRSDPRAFFSPQDSVVPEKQQSSSGMLKVVFLSFLIFGSIIGVALLAMYLDPNYAKYFTSDVLQQHQSKPGEIHINNVQFDVKPIDADKQRVIVVGNVKNPGPLAVPPQNIQLTAWGTCMKGQTPNEFGLCEIRTWSYVWKQDLLHPSQKLTFKSAVVIPANLHVDQVHVDVTEN